MRDTQPVLACDLGAPSGDERARRSTLASRIAARVRKVEEISDGYAGCLDPDPVIVRDALDWLLLERRCCPFLRLELSFGASNGPGLVPLPRRPRGQGVPRCGWSQGLSSQEPAVMLTTSLPSAALPPNHAVERTAGSPALAAAAHCECYAAINTQ